MKKGFPEPALGGSYENGINSESLEDARYCFYNLCCGENAIFPSVHSSEVILNACGLSIEVMSNACGEIARVKC